MARSGFEVQTAAITALFFREMKTRFGRHYRLGYIWAILEPALHMSVMLLIFTYIRDRSMSGISFAVFLVNGVIVFSVFSHIVNSAMHAINANRGLLDYRPIHPIDTVLARAILETVLSAGVYLFFMIFLNIIGEEFVITDLLTLITTIILLVIFSCGLGLILMVVSALYPEASKPLPVIIQMLYFLSGVIFPLYRIPYEYQNYVTWNPILHAVELTRLSAISGYEKYLMRDISLFYLAECTLVILFLGLVLYRSQQEEILRRE